MAKTIAELVDVAHRHAAAEAEGDLAATLATLEAEPVYELYPIGLRMTGLHHARRYYEHFFASVVPRIAGHELLGEWVNELGVVQEYSVAVRCDDDRVRQFRVVGLLKFGEMALSGERLYADAEFLRILFEPLWDGLEACGGGPAGSSATRQTGR